MRLSNWDNYVKAWKEQIEVVGAFPIPKYERREVRDAPPFPELYDTMQIGESILMKAKDAMTFRHTIYKRDGKSTLRFIDGGTCRIWITGKGN